MSDRVFACIIFDSNCIHFDKEMTKIVFKFINRSCINIGTLSSETHCICKGKDAQTLTDNLMHSVLLLMVEPYPDS